MKYPIPARIAMRSYRAGAFPKAVADWRPILRTAAEYMELIRSF